MRDYVGFLLARDQAHGNTRLYHEGGFEDWLAGDGVCDQSFEGGTDVGFISGVYFRNSALLTAQAARELGYQQDARRYEAQAEDIRTAILQDYFTPNGRFVLDTHTSYVLALHSSITGFTGTRSGSLTPSRPCWRKTSSRSRAASPATR